MSTERIISPFGEIASFVSGNRPQGGVGQIKEGALSLGGEHVGVDGKLALTTPKYVPLDYFNNNPKGHVLSGDILLCKDGALSGKVALERGELSGFQSMVNEHVFIIRTSELNQKYLFYYLFSPVGQRLLKGIVTGAAQGGINGKNLKSIPVVYPDSLNKQQRIVDELDLLTGIINKKNAQLRDLDALAQSIFYEMFGDPAINEKGWPVKLISDLFDVGSSKRVFESEWRDAGVPFYRAREIVRLSKGLPLEDPIYIEESLFSAYKEKYGIPAVGDIMVTGVGTLGICYLVKKEDRFYFKDGNTLWFRDKHIANSRFIKDQYSTDFVKDQIKENAHGATVGTYTIVNAKKTRVICPPVELQNEYVKTVQAVDEQKLLIEKSIIDTQNLLNSRMHKYFA